MDKDELTRWALANGWQIIGGMPSLTKPTAPKEAIVRMVFKATVVHVEVKKPAGTPDEHHDDENHPFLGQARFSLTQAMFDQTHAILLDNGVIPEAQQYADAVDMSFRDAAAKELADEDLMGADFKAQELDPKALFAGG